jgi:hypothetical protein
MATVQEKITALKSALAAGTKSASIGDMSVTYRDFDEIQKIIASLQAELDLASGAVSPPFGVTTVTYSRGL